MSLSISGKFKVAELKRKSQAEMFKGLKEGSEVEMSVALGEWRNDGITAKDCATGQKVTRSFSQMANILEAFSLEPISSTATFQSDFEEPNNAEEATHQRNLILDTIKRILIRTGQIKHGEKISAAEVFMRANKYLDEL